ITYGSSSSNHVRVIANKAKQLGIQCFIISPEENYKETFNSSLAKLLDVQVIKAPVNQVRETIDTTINNLKEDGHKPYFIQGGGHGNLGTQAYVDVYKLILENEIETNLQYDYIFFASGTGTTHAGLECGKIINNSNKE